MLHSQVTSNLWSAFSITVFVLLLADLLVFHRSNKKLGLKEAILWSVFWIALALAFNFWFYLQYGSDLGTEFLTGYLVELSLSIDNLFVILLVFKAFKIEERFQHRVLFWGILGAIIMRGLLIIVGVDLIHNFHWIMYVFGGILLFSAYKFLFDTETEKDVTKSIGVKLVKKLIPVTNTFDQERFFIRQKGVLHATPLFMALIVIEVTDLIFAVDSIPAVLAITEDAFVAFGSNILAILGLRSMYFIVADRVSNLRYLKPGLAVILGFIGIKMLLIDIYKIPSLTSLFVILGILFTAGLGSWYANRRDRMRFK